MIRLCIIVLCYTKSICHMKTHETSTRKTGGSTKPELPVSESSVQPSTGWEESSREYSTIDGEVINRTDGSDAVSKGKGLFIGDYFVGIPDSLSGWAGAPHLRY